MKKYKARKKKVVRMQKRKPAARDRAVEFATSADLSAIEAVNAKWGELIPVDQIEEYFADIKKVAPDYRPTSGISYHEAIDFLVGVCRSARDEAIDG